MVLAVALVVLGGAAYVLVAYSQRERPGPKSIGEAVQQYRGHAPNSSGGSARYAAPAPGVYVLQGQGSEHINFPPNSQTDGSTMPGSVRYLGGNCWSWHVDYNAAHWEDLDFCPRGDQLLMTGYGNGQSWDFGLTRVTNEAQFTCAPGTVLLPADPQTGQALKWACTGSNTAVAGASTASTAARFVATGTMKVGGATVPFVHQAQTTTLSGSQKGSVTENWWFSARSGLPLRMERHITINTPSPVGTITYHEDGWWQMRTLQART